MGANDVVIVDTTEVPINRSSYRELQMATYSGYKKRTTLKYEVALSEQTGLPISVVGPFVGSTADITIFRSCLRNMMFYNNWTGIADGTYQGEPDFLLVPPRPFHGLTPEQRAFYHYLSQRRIVIENFFGRLKRTFHCLAIQWRHSILIHHLVFRVCVQILSIDLVWRPLRK